MMENGCLDLFSHFLSPRSTLFLNRNATVGLPITPNRSNPEGVQPAATCEGALSVESDIVRAIRIPLPSDLERVIECLSAPAFLAVKMGIKHPHVSSMRKELVV